jgi:hypothetical protein
MEKEKRVYIKSMSRCRTGKRCYSFGVWYASRMDIGMLLFTNITRIFSKIKVLNVTGNLNLSTVNHHLVTVN